MKTCLPIALALATLSLGCRAAINTNPNGPIGVGPMVKPPDRSLFLRQSLDDDPSSYIGRFVDTAVGPDELDEAGARQSRCSKYISYKVVNASGSFTQSFNASDGAKGSIGVAGYGEASASSGSSAGVLIKYQLKKKMLGEIKDMDAYVACCEAAQGECTDRYVGEFLYGSGTVSQFAGYEDQFKADGGYQITTADFSFENGAAWKRVTTFENVYFAFKTHGATKGGGLCEAGDPWARTVPQSLDGKFFVGVSPQAGSESKAREYAMRDARRQVIKYLGESIVEAHTNASSLVNDALKDDTYVEAAAAGVAQKVKDRCWSAPDVARMPAGPMTIMKVLAFFPEKELAAAQLAMVDAMAKAASKAGDAGKAKALEALEKTVAPK